MNQDISYRLKEFFNELRLSQVKVARDLETSPAHVNDIFNGRSNPTSNTLVKICKTYDLNINWLLTGNGNKTISETNNKSNKNIDSEIINMQNEINRLNKILADTLLDYSNLQKKYLELTTK